MRTKNVVLLIAGGAVAFAALAWFAFQRIDVTIDTSSPMQRQIETEVFDRLVLEGTFDVNVSQGDTLSVTVSGTEANLSRLSHRVEDGALYLGLNETGIQIGRSATKVDVVVPTLKEISIKGSSNVDLEDMTLDAIALQLSGAGNLEASGSCQTLTVSLAGAGNVEARELECRVVEAEMAGAGNMEVFASESIAVRLHGVGNIEVYGNPAARKTEKLGIGHVTYHDRPEAGDDNGQDNAAE